MVRDAGLLLTDLKRVTLPVFTTEQAVDRESVSPRNLSSVLADPESRTYQFVVQAVLHDGDQEVAAGRARSPCRTELDRAHPAHVGGERARRGSEPPSSTCTSRSLRQSATRVASRPSRRSTERNIEAIQSTRSYRMLAPFRRRVQSAQLSHLGWLMQGRDEGAAVRAVAFYLPQFHPIPENDVVGPGVHRVANVVPARPLFPATTSRTSPPTSASTTCGCRRSARRRPTGRGRTASRVLLLPLLVRRPAAARATVRRGAEVAGHPDFPFNGT